MLLVSPLINIKNKNLAEYFLLTSYIMGLAITLSSCKKLSSHDQQNESSELKALYSGKYYLGLQKSKEASKHVYQDNTGNFKSIDTHNFQFVVCLVTKQTTYPKADAPKYVRDSGVARLGVKDNFTINTSSCIPAFTNDNKTPVKLVPLLLNPIHSEWHNDYLNSEKIKTSISNGMLEVAAFGAGASLAGFNQNLRQSIISLFPQAKRARFFAFIIQLANLSLPHQTQSSSDFLTLITQPEDSLVLVPATEEEKTNRLPRPVTATASFAAGFALNTVITSKAALLGPWTGLAAQNILPFLSFIILNLENNVSQDLLKNYKQLFQTHDIKKNIPDQAKQVSDIPKAIHVLGRSFVVSRWVKPDQLTKACLPITVSDGTTQSECRDVFETDLSTYHLGRQKQSK
ncbi:MAG: hypothetical protein OXC40_04735 [Proteobacteria bacterium]|nr:hypothetical protein [Pseudomonadota bacterium]